MAAEMIQGGIGRRARAHENIAAGDLADGLAQASPSWSRTSCSAQRPCWHRRRGGANI
jgi:hypothetical protein